MFTTRARAAAPAVLAFGIAVSGGGLRAQEPPAAADAPKAPAAAGAEAARTPAARLRELVEGYRAAQARAVAVLEAAKSPEDSQARFLEIRRRAIDAQKVAKTDGERLEAARAHPHDPLQQFSELFLDLAKAAPDDAAAVDAFLWLMANARYSPEAEEAADLVVRRHVAGGEMKRVCRALWLYPSPTCEAVMRQAMRKSPDREVQGLARLALARSIMQRADAGEGPTTDRERSRWVDGEGMKREADELLGQVLSGYGGLADPVLGGTMADQARAARDELRRLAVGAAAPEIEGRDADGKAFRLSDYRGKVVLLDFGGSWCPFCVTDYPRLRGLAARFEGRPFALLGVNSDGPEALRETIKKGDVTWRSWSDGGTDGPINKAWNVLSWPSLVLIDHEGVIRFKGRALRDERQAAEAIETLLKAREPRGVPGR